LRAQTTRSAPFLSTPRNPHRRITSNPRFRHSSHLHPVGFER
jgi:hypothetical protein